MVKIKMQIAETPEARNFASVEARPACWKSRGAYCPMIRPRPIEEQVKDD